MSARVLSILLSLALAAAVVMSAIALAFAVVAPLVGQPLDAGFSVACATPGAPPCSVEPGTDGARFTLHEGELTLTSSSLAATLLRVLDVALTGGFWIALTGLLRRFTRHASGGRPFTPATARQLTWTGLLLLAFPLWELIRSALWQLIVVMEQPLSGRLIHTFTTAPAPDAISLLPEFSPGLAVAGLVLLVIARAFAVGVEVQRDSDEIV